MQVIRDWFQRHLSDPQVVILAALLLVGIAIVFVFGGVLAPFFASIVIAYLLEGVVQVSVRAGVPRLAAVLVVFLGFMVFLLLIFFWLLPVLFEQTTQIVYQFPAMINEVQRILLLLSERYPDFISKEHVKDIVDRLSYEVGKLGQRVLAISVAYILSLITLLVYLILMPFLVFFFLKDKDLVLQWIASFLPRERTLVDKVWHDVDQQFGNYIQGKFIEILIVWVVTYLCFSLLGLHHAVLLGLFVGLSVLIPYIGAAVMTLPVALVAYFQWGFDLEFIYVMVAYAIIQALDGNVLAPILLSKATDLHPVATIAAILVFGGLWGFWGILFAIPLATLVHAVLKAWPSQVQRWEQEQEVVQEVEKE